MQPRRLALAIGAAVIAAGLLVPAVGIGPWAGTARAGTTDCSTGWTDSSEAPQLSIYDTMSIGGTGVSVGTERRFLADRSYITSWFRKGAWVTERGPGMPGDSALVAVGGDRIDRVWAVGFQDDGRARGIAVHWEGGQWVRHDPPRPTSGGMVLSAVDVDPAGRVWVVGQSVSDSAARTGLVLERKGGAWHRRNVPVGRGSGFTSVRAIASDNVWVAGSRLTNHGIRPIIGHWDGSRWTMETITAAGNDALLSGIAGNTSNDLWAAGWATRDGRAEPLVLHRDATGWKVVDPPDFGGLYTLLADISVDGQGRPWVVGGVYRDTVDLYVPVAARLDGTTWTNWPRPPGPGRYLDAVSGDPSAGGWASGRSDIGGLRLRACEPVASASRAGRISGHGATRPVDDLAGDEAGPAPRRGLPAVPRLAAAVAPAGPAPRDVAASVGIDQTSRTYGATWADLDDDGRKDLFISGHAGPAALYLRINGGFKRQAAGVFRDIDRHDCDVARIDADRLADVVCTGGADRGIGFKANEIWIDPVNGTPDDQGPARGIADPTGRGRQIAVFDVEGDGDPDIVFGTSPMRWDSQPSPLRLMRNDGTGRFTWDPASGIPAEKGAWCLVPVDIDGDGDKDLLQCAVVGNVVPTARLLVLRNDGGRFRQVQRAWGVRTIGERDAAVGDLGGDGHPDLVQLATSRIRVSVWKDGQWVTTFERRISAGRSIAVGDIDRDGHDDIYLQMGSGSHNTDDVVLRNTGDGTDFTTIAVPSTSQGSAEDVIPLDWNSDGRTDFLVLNGNLRPGPVQLIDFGG